MVFGSGPQVPTVDAEEAHRLHASGDATIIDVRGPGERQAAHIPGSVHIPLDQLADRIDRIPEDGKVIFQCHSGARSAQACAYLGQHGHEQAYNLDGGIVAWHRSGLPLER